MVRRTVAVLSCMSVALSWSAAAPAMEDRPLVDLTRLPLRAASIGDFVPQSWKVEEQIDGDLDRDGTRDVVLKLIEDLPDNDIEDYPADRRRALLVLLRRSGAFVRAGTNNQLLVCTGCGGAFYGVIETPVDVSIVKGVLVVHQEWGSRWVTEETYRFRYDPAAGRFVLIGQDVVVHDRAIGTTVKESTNLITGDHIKEHIHYDQQSDRDRTVSEKHDKVSRKTLFLEDVK